MGFRTMKEDLFTIKALEAKGYPIQTILAMSEEELDALPISTRLIESAKDYKKRGGKTAEEIAEEIADMMMSSEPTHINEEVLQEYSTEVQEEVIEGATPVMTEEEVAVFDDIAFTATEVSPEQEVQEVQIIRTESAQDDVKLIKESLQRKEAKSFQPFIKHLKSEVPPAILDAVDSTLVSELIEARIAEVKAAQELTK